MDTVIVEDVIIILMSEQNFHYRIGDLRCAVKQEKLHYEKRM